jgi:hypothetical protein
MIQPVKHLDGLILAHDGGSRIPHVKILKAVRGLRNRLAHVRSNYQECRRELRLPQDLPNPILTNSDAYIDEVLFVYKKLNVSLETIKEKIISIISKASAA